VESLDESGIPGMVAQGLSNLFNALNNCIVGNGGALPEVFDQLFFTDQRLAMFQQIQKQVEGLLAEMLFYPVSLETTSRGIDLDVVEAIDRPILNSMSIRRHDR